MSSQYTQKNKKEKLIEDSSLLCHEYYLTTRKSSPKWFQYHYKRLDDDIERGRMHHKSNDLEINQTKNS